MTRPKKIKIISPEVQQSSSEPTQDAHFHISEGFLLSQSWIANGPGSVECEFDTVMAAPYVVARAIELDADGADAIVINSIYDPGLASCRELLTIPVFGSGEVSLQIACMLGNRFSVIQAASQCVSQFERRVAKLGLLPRMASVRSVNLIPDSLDEDSMFSGLVDEAAKAVSENCADIIILGHTSFSKHKIQLEDVLQARGISVPIIDPTKAAVAYAAAVLRLGRTHSKRSFPIPSAKLRTGYPIAGVAPLP